MIERKLKLELPDALEIVILLFIFAADILGEIQEYYVLVPHWDTVLHTVNGFLFAAIGFCIVNILNENKKISLTLSPFYMAVAAFCFSMTIGVLWEFFEYSGDIIVRTDMQKDTIINNISTVVFDPLGENNAVLLNNIKTTTLTYADGTTFTFDGYLDIGIMDTMKDLFVNFIGAAVFSAFGYICVNTRGKRGTRKVVESFVPRVNKEELTDDETDGRKS
jgi:hypothetical protein